MRNRNFRLHLFCLFLSQAVLASFVMNLAASAQSAHSPLNTSDAPEAPHTTIKQSVSAAKAALNPVNAAKKAKQALSSTNSAAKAAKEKLTKTLAPPEPTYTVRDKWAFLVGLEAFNDDTVKPMKNAQQNAVLISSFLASPDLGKFGPSRVVVVTNNKATKNNVTKALGDTWLLKNALPNDLIVLYFCTRAQWKSDGSDLLLYMFDTPSSQPELAAIPLKATLTNLQKRTQSKHILCLLDLGPVVRTDDTAEEAATNDDSAATAAGMSLEKIAQESGTTILASNVIGGKTYPSSTKACSAFVENLLEGLATSKGEIEFEQVAQYVVKMVKDKVAQDFRKEQTPVFAPSETGAPMLKTVVATAVKSSTPEKHAKFGHPPERAPDDSHHVVNIPAPKITTKTKVEDDDDDIDYSKFGPVDYGPYMSKMKRDIQSKWIPPKGFKDQKVVAVFTIMKDGSITNASIADGSGVAQIDESAMAALKSASPLDPLPAGAPPYVQMRYVFEWKVTKN
ncbi:TonB C-terminal domain-containing protein [Candidatus Obscuribacterales bacterium]|nr:TonB C-terminal domain-containing protein [Candidatus Obscuribacterales bacterium]MBX3153682.1 TonB C-terminal domain-containing protein [Candidatus Obscuribacterales bacterium]